MKIFAFSTVGFIMYAVFVFAGMSIIYAFNMPTMVENWCIIITGFIVWLFILNWYKNKIIKIAFKQFEMNAQKLQTEQS